MEGAQPGDLPEAVADCRTASAAAAVTAAAGSGLPESSPEAGAKAGVSAVEDDGVRIRGSLEDLWAYTAEAEGLLRRLGVPYVVLRETSVKGRVAELLGILDGGGVVGGGVGASNGGGRATGVAGGADGPVVSACPWASLLGGRN
ncbi:hypothetical protein GPECTOR_59g673 [Gonium pectorale]|uniref:Uncharacterized protein n=1 Tax=Gonium pectorale TaxID=33097 RepID=A0A150G5G7_GONPE|nr:hypothetical protein GPECTOR_59g673 [Gonium pectorale]|eukprot:KXZ45064.1 hypothetical protein GPECTOR_59g673 [Gonium pectorale]